MGSTGMYSRAAVLTLVTWAAIILALIAASGPAFAQDDNATLEATVGPNSTIAMTRGGRPVTSLEAGTYTIEVDDRSENHDFHLAGAGVDETTTVPEVATKTWTVTLSEGTYTFVCDPHAENMKGSFTVNAASDLPLTGLGAVGVALLGASLVGSGVALTIITRRRRPKRQDA